MMVQVNLMKENSRINSMEIKNSELKDGLNYVMELLDMLGQQLIISTQIKILKTWQISVIEH